MRLIICFFLGLIPFAWANTPEETPLLPEVQQLLTLEAIDESAMDQNAYVALMGLNAALDIDAIEAGKKIILNNFHKLKKAYDQRNMELYDKLLGFEGYYPQDKTFSINLEVDGAKYLFPCRAYYSPNCLEQTLADRETITLLMARNNALLQRHAKIVKLPDFDYYYSSASAPMPVYQTFMGLTDLRLAEAIFAINDGNIDSGLAILQENMNFAKRLLAGKGTIIDTMIAVRQLAKIYHVFSALIDSDLLANELNNPELIALLQPLSTKEQQPLIISMKAEQSMIFAGIYYSFDDAIRENFGTKSKERVPDFNASINFLYEENGLLFEILKRVLPESGKYYREYLANNKIDHQIRALANKNKQKYARKNIISSTAVLEGNFYKFALEKEGLLYRLYDLSNYLALVNAQLKIKQADIKAEELPKFLVKMGNDAKNPYSNKPFIWDEKMQTLSSDWLSTRNKTEERDGERAIVKIKFKAE